MIYSATIIYFDEKMKDEVVKNITAFKSVEIHHADYEKGKLVITIEAADSNEIEHIERELLTKSGIIDVEHFAFHFGEEVELMEQGEKVPDVGEMFKSHIDKKNS